MKRFTHGGAAALILVCAAAFLAAGCGSSSNASDAVKNSKALDFIPKTAVGYVTVDTDLKGDNWKQAGTLANAFDSKVKPIDQELADEAKKDDSSASYAKDIDPWLGKSAGVAILDIKNNNDVVGWVEVSDRAKLDSFLKDQKLTKGAKTGDFTLWTKHGESTELAVSDDLAFFGEKAAITKTIKHTSGSSISDADGLSDVTDNLDGDSLATLVISGDGLRTAVKESGTSAKDLDSVPTLKDLKGFAATVSAKDDGFHVQAVAKGSGLDAKEASPDLLKALPGNTLFAVGGQDLGGQIKSGLNSAGKTNAQVQQGVGAISGALGIDIDDIAKAFDGQFQLALSGDDAGLQGLVGTAAGAAMGGGLSNVNPSALTKAGAITLAFENGNSTAATVDKLFGAVGGLTGGATPKTGTAGDFQTKTLAVQGIPITAASSKDVSAISVGTDVFSKWGSDKLGDNDTFSSAWDAANAPDKVSASFWLDWPRVAKLAGLTGGDKATAGGWVGWGNADGDKATFDLFMHVTKN